MSGSRRALVAALVGPEHQQAYMTNATFRVSIDTLAAMLPAWVDGMASSAVMQEAERQRAVQMLAAAPAGWVSGIEVRETRFGHEHPYGPQPGIDGRVEHDA